MANKRNKKKLNSKQANRIPLVIIVVYFIGSLVNGMISEPARELGLYYWIVDCIISAVLFMLFYF